MKTYTINGKEYSEFDINLWIARKVVDYEDIAVNPFPENYSDVSYGDGAKWHTFNPCHDPADTWPIIEKVWNELMEVHVEEGGYITKWELLMKRHSCTKLVAACICFIEVSS